MTRSAGSERSTSMPSPLTVEVIEDVQQPERPAIAEMIRHEVHRPDRVRDLILRFSSSPRVIRQTLVWFQTHPRT
ncbi:MAG: hypothetical protein ACJA1L_002613 [Paracoccaceae bacterium]|jgi:hypothetical protein